MYSRFIRAMLAIEISFGQTASHSPSFEQLPNPSASCRSTIAIAQAFHAQVALRQQRAVRLTLAAVKEAANAFLQAATQSPQPIQAAESIACSTTCPEMSMAFPSGAPPTLMDV